MRSARTRTHYGLTTDTPDEHETGTAAGGFGDHARVDGSVLLAEFPSELLVILARRSGNPLALLVSKAHLSKSFRSAACRALAVLECADLRDWSRTVDDAAVKAVVSKCPQLSSLVMSGCKQITEVAVAAMVSKCPKISSLNLTGCEQITDAAVVAVASKCKKLKSLFLDGCENITGAAVVAVAWRCKKLEELDLAGCTNVTDAVIARIPDRICVCGP